MRCLGVLLSITFSIMILGACKISATPAPSDSAPSFAQADPASGTTTEDQTMADPLQGEIRRARFSIQVKDFEASTGEIRRFVAEKKGLVAQSEQKLDDGEQPSGTLVLKIPVENYADALAFLKNLGKVYEFSETMENIRDQLVDLDARLRNARQLESRILAILKDQTGSIGDVIEAERELANIRQRIEELDAKRQNLRRTVEYATFTLHLFVSGSRDVEARTWYGPLVQDLKNLGFVAAESTGVLAKAFIAVIPWIVVIWIVLRIRKQRREKKG